MNEHDARRDTARRQRQTSAANAAIDAMDGRVLGHVAVAAQRHDPVPDGLVERIQFAVALDEVYEEVARIQRLDSDELVGARAGAPATDRDVRQSMSFTVGDVTVIVSMARDGTDSVAVDGWVAVNGTCTVAIRLQDDTREVVATHGRFRFDAVPCGMMQLLVTTPDGDKVATPTLQL